MVICDVVTSLHNIEDKSRVLFPFKFLVRYEGLVVQSIVVQILVAH